VGLSPSPVRSYQRIFKPERRIYQIDGRRLPVPGGVSLDWLAWAFMSLLAVLLVGSRSVAFTLVASGVAGALAVEPLGARRAAGVFAAGVLGLQAAGVLLGWIDWPLRLLILPGFLATAAGELSPDGRAAHKYLLSRLLVRLRAGRRSLERPLELDGEPAEWAPRVWVAPDCHTPVLGYGRVHGPAEVAFARPVAVVRRRGGRYLARPLHGQTPRHGELTGEVVRLRSGQVLEVRP
jgi:hypothetical protein